MSTLHLIFMIFQLWKWIKMWTSRIYWWPHQPCNQESSIVYPSILFEWAWNGSQKSESTSKSMYLILIYICYRQCTVWSSHNHKQLFVTIDGDGFGAKWIENWNAIHFDEIGNLDALYWKWEINNLWNIYIHLTTQKKTNNLILR